MAVLAYIAMGSNIAPKTSYLNQALYLLHAQFPQRFSYSSWYLGQPYQQMDQEAYVNGACRFETHLSPEQLLKQIFLVERHLGRVRTEKKWDNRTIDLDIALFGDEVICQKDLKIPHYDLEHRDFVLVPMLELNPSLMHPKTNKSLAWHLQQIPEEKQTWLKKLGRHD